MPKIRSSSKRKVRIPARFGNTVCELNKKKDGRDFSVVKVANDVANHRVTRGSVPLLAVWGKPVMMDQTTTKMCNKGVGRIGYARVLVEVTIKNILKNKVEICFKNAKQETCLTKFVNVLYDWVPPSCELCKIFGHTHEKCLVRHRSEEEKQRISKGKNNQETRRENNGVNQKSNVDAREQRNVGLGKQTTSNGNDKSGNVNVEYRPINKGLNDGDKNIEGNNEKNKGHTKNGNEKRNNRNSHFSGRWNVNKDLVDSVRRSANKYAIFASVDEAEMGENQMNVDMSEIEKNADDEFEDVLDEVAELARNMSKDDLFAWNVRETHIKSHKMGKICDFVFGNWSWQSNIDESSRGCKIVVGWNRDIVNVMVLHCSEQTMLYLLESIENKKKFFYCFTYAANHGKDRRSLGKNLIQYKIIVDMIEFKECLEEIKVEDLNCSGLHYTWIQSRLNPKNGILKKIDRVLGNNSFMGNFPSTHAMFLPHLSSDHCLVVLIVPKMVRKIKKAFKFANFTTEKPEFPDIVKKGWDMELSWKNGNLYEIVKKWKEELQNIQTRANANPHDAEFKREEAKIMKGYSTAAQDEEIFLCQQAKIDWLRDGDRNSKFFHAILKSRNHKNGVAFLGSSFTIKEIEDTFMPMVRVSSSDADDMTKAVTSKEIKEALFDIEDNKAPGPDGFSSKIFKKAWPVVGDDVCMAIKEFFHNWKLLGEVNATLISLVPKIETPTKVSDFRPIACCNVIYKCISKILTNMIKNSLCKVVSPNQSAFIPGRQITDNILISQELLRGYNWKNGAKRITTTFLIKVNGEMYGYFKGGMGLRQGDPISPYLFTLVMEMLNIVVQEKIKENPRFRYHWGCKQLKISHLCFVDDLLMFYHGDVESVKVIKGDLDEFSKMSRLVPNLGKSTLGINECKCLVEKVRAKVNCWKNKMLTYARRLQLISSVLSSIHVYWASVFMLPKVVIKDINRLLKGFLCRSNSSSGWKQMLMLRDKMRSHVVNQIGNGKKIFFWHDNWSGKGTLSFLFGQDILKNQNVKSDAKADIEDRTLWLRLTSLRVKDSPQVKKVADKWQVRMNSPANEGQNLIADMVY
ncbi:RNA-directed DNA polymerase, eukaryota, reverse transcriptase zinc-binding domain protein [Tanacetum coccineum]